MICCECTISNEHCSKHDFHRIAECYPIHYQQIQNNLDIVKQRLAVIDISYTQLATSETEVLQQGEQLKKEINTHAQQIIDKVERSRTQLAQQLDTIIQRKTELLVGQKQQAQEMYTRLKQCEETIEHSLKEWNQQQILTGKQILLDKVKSATQYSNPMLLQAIEYADVEFTKTAFEKEIGYIESNCYSKAIVELPTECHLRQPSIATLTLKSVNSDAYLSLPKSLINSEISCNLHPVSKICDIAQPRPGHYSITFTPSTRQDQLTVQIRGVNVPGSPFTLPIIPSPATRGELVDIISGFKAPKGIAVCDNGMIAVVEAGASCVTVLSKDGKKVKSFGTKGTGKGQFLNAYGVAISTDKHLLVTDEHRLQKLSAISGVCIESVGNTTSGKNRQQFHNPKGIAVHPTTGYIFVADSGNNRIQVFTKNLTYSHAFTQRDGEPLRQPYDIALSNDGEFIYIAEFATHQITLWTVTGQFIRSFCHVPGQLRHPSSLTVSNNLVYVCECDFRHCVSIFNTDGELLNCFGKKGIQKGEFNLPHGIATTKSGVDVYVCDSSNNRIVIF